MPWSFGVVGDGRFPIAVTVLPRHRKSIESLKKEKPWCSRKMVFPRSNLGSTGQPGGLPLSFRSSTVIPLFTLPPERGACRRSIRPPFCGIGSPRKHFPFPPNPGLHGLPLSPTPAKVSFPQHPLLTIPPPPSFPLSSLRGACSHPQPHLPFLRRSTFFFSRSDRLLSATTFVLPECRSCVFSFREREDGRKNLLLSTGNPSPCCTGPLPSSEMRECF